MLDQDSLDSLLAIVEKGHDADKRVSAITSLSQQLDAHLYHDHHDSIDLSLKASLKTSNPTVLSVSLQTLPNLTRLFPSSNHASIKRHLLTLLPTTLERLGDHNKRVREAAKEAVIAMGHLAFQSSSTAGGAGGGGPKGKENESPLILFERLFKEGGLMAKSPKIKEPSLTVLLSLRTLDDKFPLRPFLPSSVELLSDADATVRDSARRTLISLFSKANDNAKSDLRREMERLGVRRQTVESVMGAVVNGNGGGNAEGAGAVGMDSPGNKTSMSLEGERLVNKTPAAPTTRRVATQPLGNDAEAGGSGQGQARIEVAPAPPAPAPAHAAAARADDQVTAVWVSSRAELDRLFHSMHPHFIGKESEHNWLAREEDVLKIKGLLKSEAHHKFMDGFVAGLKGVVDGILKGAASLRTTLAMHSLTLIGDLATALGDNLEPLSDQLLTSLVKMAGFTKKMVANASQASVKSILTNLHYRHNFLHIVVPGMQDKNVGMRLAMCLHISTILDVHASHRKHLVESHDGLSMLLDALKRGLPDSNKDVRANAREAFFKFQCIWPNEAAQLLHSLEPAIQKQVQVAAAALPKVISTSNIPAGAVLGGAAHSGPNNTPATTTTTTTTTRTTTGGVARRPGGPSVALLAAKRAASEKLARQRAAEAEAAAEAERAKAQAEAEAEVNQEEAVVGEQAREERGDEGEEKKKEGEAEGEVDEVEETPEMDGDVGVDKAVMDELGSEVQEQELQQQQEPQQQQVEKEEAEHLHRVQAEEQEAGVAQETEEERSRVLEPQAYQPASSSHSNGNSNGRHASVSNPAPPPSVPPVAISPTPPLPPPINAKPISPTKAPSGTDWFSKQANRLVSNAPDSTSTSTYSASPRKKRPEVEDWLKDLNDGKADLKVFRRLAKLSSDFKIGGGGEGEDEGDGGVEGGIEGWTEGNLFDRLWVSLLGFVNSGHRSSGFTNTPSTSTSTSEAELTTGALVVLQKLVENQFPLIASTRREEELLSFVLGLRKRRSRTAWSACETILDSWCKRTDPILGLGALANTLREVERRVGGSSSGMTNGGELDSSTSDEAAQLLAPGLRCFAKVVLKLPPELLEDEIGHGKDLIKSALQHPNVDLRQAAVAVLVACHRGLGDQEALLQILQPLDKAQMDLLSYYFSKSR